MYVEKQETYRKNLLVYRAIAHKMRLEMLELMYQREEAILSNLQNGNNSDVLLPHTVEDFYKTNPICPEQSIASQHLAILRKLSIVQRVRSGKCYHYSLTEKGKEILTQCSTLLTT